MRRLALSAAAGLALVLSACGDSPCQELGERICACQPGGLSADTCKAQVEKQLEDIDPSKAFEDKCQQYLDACNAPAGANLCEWLLTERGKQACGLAP
jgi:hypothetical protein